MKFQENPIDIHPIPEGGGYLATIPDLPSYAADGETIEAAIAAAWDAFRSWNMAGRENQGELPPLKTCSGQFVQRIPKTSHMRLTNRAASKWVSLNQLAVAFLAEGLGDRLEVFV